MSLTLPQAISFPKALKKHPQTENYRYLELSVCEDHVLIVTLNRPKKHNALNARMWKEIGMLFSQIGVTEHFCMCRCVLLIGSGPSFCAGIDVRDTAFFKSLNDNNGEDVARAGLAFEGLLKDMQQAFSAVDDGCPVPVVAAVHGYTVGAAIDLVTAAQIRMCCQDTKFSIKEVAIGLAADVGTLQRLPKVSGNQSLVHELCYTGRLFGPEEALQMGLVSRVTTTQQELYQQALELCLQISQHSPLAVQGTKRALLYSRDHSVHDGLQQIAAYNLLALQGPDVQIAMMAASAKQSVEFQDLNPRARL